MGSGSTRLRTPLLPASDTSGTNPRSGSTRPHKDSTELTRSSDTEALQQHLLSKCEQSGVQILSGRAVEVDAQGETASLRTEDGVALQGRVLVDASGHNTPFIERKGTFAHGHQVAVGYWMDVEQHPFQPGEMALMDFRDVPEFPEESPTFLYALPISDRTLFVEETSLVSRPALGFDALERRLHQRLEHLNLSPVAIHEKEYCQFPMGLALPKKAQRILAFGGAASMVHPATGYQLAHALRAAPGVADCLKTGLTAGPAADAVQAAWETLWPTKKRQSWELYQFGMNFLVAQNAPDTRKFFGAFFDQNDEQWQGYLSGTLPPNLVGKSMKSVFSSLDGSMRWKLIRAGGFPKGLHDFCRRLSENPNRFLNKLLENNWLE